MNQKKRYYFYLLIICLFITGMFFVMPVHADTGPKPFVDITVTGIDGRTCYGTLLSKEKSTGPASVWDGTEEPYVGEGGKEIWSKFQAYQDTDGFYFLNWNWAVSDEEPLHWDTIRQKNSRCSYTSRRLTPLWSAASVTAMLFQPTTR